MNSVFMKTSKTLIRNNLLFKVNSRSLSDKFKDKESAEEAIFVNKQERETMKKLLLKIKAEQDKNHVETELKDLKAVLTKHKVANVTDALLKDIQAWKQTHH